MLCHNDGDIDGRGGGGGEEGIPVTPAAGGGHGMTAIRMDVDSPAVIMGRHRNQQGHAEKDEEEEEEEEDEGLVAMAMTDGVGMMALTTDPFEEVALRVDNEDSNGNLASPSSGCTAQQR